MRRRLSIGTQWTVLYTLALLVTVSIFGFYTYSQVSARTQRDAQLVLELQMADVVDAMLRAGDASAEVAESVERTVQVADSDLKLGLQVFGRDGTALLSRGSLVTHPIPLPEVVKSGERPRLSRLVEVGENYPYLVMALEARGGFVQGTIYTRRFVRNARDVRDIYLYSLPVLLIVTALVGSFLARGILRPLQEMNATARRISATRLSETIPTTGSGDELDDLAFTLNDMLARIRRSVERMRRFSANAAHELRTPLNSMRSRLEVTLEKDRESEEYRRTLAEMAEEVELLSNSVHGMMRLAQSEAGLSAEQREPVEIVALLSEVLDFFQPLAEEAEIELSSSLDHPMTVPGDPDWLRQLFANLLHNAIKYTPKGGKVYVEIEERSRRAAIHVRDTGVGIAVEEQSRVFEPFHRVGARPETPGAGLGLALAREITRAHGGDVTLASTPGEGSCFSVWLPLDEEGEA